MHEPVTRIVISSITLQVYAPQILLQECVTSMHVNEMYLMCIVVIVWHVVTVPTKYQ